MNEETEEYVFLNELKHLIIKEILDIQNIEDLYAKIKYWNNNFNS